MSGGGNRLRRHPVPINRRGSGVDLLDEPPVQHPPQHRLAVTVKLRPDLAAGRVTEVGGDLRGGCPVTNKSARRVLLFSGGRLTVARRGAGTSYRELLQHVSVVWCSLSLLISSLARADPPHLQHLAGR